MDDEKRTSLGKDATLTVRFSGTYDARLFPNSEGETNLQLTFSPRASTLPVYGLVIALVNDDQSSLMRILNPADVMHHLIDLYIDTGAIDHEDKRALARVLKKAVQRLEREYLL